MILPNPVGYPESVDARCSFVNNSCCFLANPHAFPESPAKIKTLYVFPLNIKKRT